MCPSVMPHHQDELVVASILCQSEICVGLRQFWAANLVVATIAAFVVVVAAFVVVAATNVNTVPVCGSVASGMRCLLNTPRMLIVN